MRLFVAIELDDKVRRAMERLQNAWKPRFEDVRWVPAQQLHVTLKFLGDVDDAEVSEVAGAVSQAAAACEPFDIATVRCGCFPPGGAVRAVWSDVQEQSGALTRCVEALEAQCVALGFAPDRRLFSAHVTIGRVRRDRSAGRLRSIIESTEMRSTSQSVSFVTLMSSVLSPKGPTYTPVCEAPLGRPKP